MNIKVTEAAGAEIKKIQQEGKFLRIMVSRTGCCGYSFSFYADERRTGDEFLEVGEYRFLITAQEKVMIDLLKGIDYGRKGLFKDFRAVTG